jgi:type I restriction enzyme S subunit
MGNLYTFKVTNSFSRENLNYKNGTVKNIHYGDIHTKFQTLFDVSKESVPFINPDISIDRITEDNYCQEGDLILADASEDLTDVGKSIEVINLNNEKMLSGLHTILARPTLEKISIGFSGYLFKSYQVRTQIQKESQGSKVLSISSTRLSNISLVIPSNEEQQKIASIFTFIDSKLQSLKQKKALLEKYKKGVMQKLFSQEIRFKDDTSTTLSAGNGKEFPEWKKKKLGEVLTIGSGKDYKHLELGDIPVFGTGGYMTSVNAYLHDGETVCIGRKGTIDSPMYYNGKIWTVDTLFYTHSFINSIPKFIYYVFQTINWKEYNEASGVPSLSKSTIEKILMSIPCHAEQTKIANFLSSIDEKINRTENQIQQTQKWKKGLLQKMFC